MASNQAITRFKMNLVFASHNLNKTKEIAQLIGNSMSIQSLDEIGCLDEIIENGNTLRENASIKSNFIFSNYKMNCFADDTGLLVESLNNEPGVFSARYAGEQKNADDNMNLLLKKLDGISNRRAKFVTVISLIIDGVESFFEGELCGEIITEKKGNKGFGYDPIFMPDGYSITLAEMDMNEKNKISHRAIAFNKLKNYLLEK